MILDKGICSIYAVSNSAAAGNKPVAALTLKYKSWYGELNFETNPGTVGAQEAVAADNRIRILQNRAVSNHDVAVVDGVQYNVTRAYHGIDDESGELITDLTLERLVPTYGVD